MGVKDIFGGIPTLPSLSVSGNAYRVLFTNAPVNTCNNNLLTKPRSQTMAHSYWITKDPTPLKTLPTMCLYTCALLINYCKAITIIDAVVCVCVCLCVSVSVSTFFWKNKNIDNSNGVLVDFKLYKEKK